MAPPTPSYDGPPYSADPPSDTNDTPSPDAVAPPSSISASDSDSDDIIFPAAAATRSSESITIFKT